MTYPALTKPCWQKMPRNVWDFDSWATRGLVFTDALGYLPLVSAETFEHLDVPWTARGPPSPETIKKTLLNPSQSRRISCSNITNLMPITSSLNCHQDIENRKSLSCFHTFRLQHLHGPPRNISGSFSSRRIILFLGINHFREQQPLWGI